jgi:hypothetical protein
VRLILNFNMSVTSNICIYFTAIVGLIQFSATVKPFNLAQ